MFTCSALLAAALVVLEEPVVLVEPAEVPERVAGAVFAVVLCRRTSS